MANRKERNEMLKDSGSNIDDAFNARGYKKFDLRIIRSFANLFSDDVYDRVNQIFPNRMDTSLQRHTKIWDLTRKHKPQKDVFLIRHGGKILSLLTGVTAVYTVNHFRSFLKLRHYARLAMFGTSLFFPSFIGAAVHDLNIAHAMVTKEEMCASCTAVKSGIYHCLFSHFYVYTTTSILGLYYASAYATISLPPNFLWHRPNAKKALQLARDISRKNKFSMVFMGLFMLNMSAGYYIGYAEQQEMLNLYGTLLLREQHKKDNIRAQAVV